MFYNRSMQLGIIVQKKVTKTHIFNNIIELIFKQWDINIKYFSSIKIKMFLLMYLIDTIIVN